MKLTKKIFLMLIVFLCLCLFGLPQAMAGMDAFDVNKMSDMSDFDPNNPIIPTGDTIKIAVVASFSGPSASVAENYWACATFVAHDINKRGGILVDGKKKKIQLIKANHMSKPAQTKKICERMVLQEKVDILWGTNGSNNMKVINQVAKKYKVIAQDFTALSDELYDATNFTRYSFMTVPSCDVVGSALAYYYGKIRRKETKFYILGQDYLFGHSMAKGFKRGLKVYYPEAQLVGEDYHKLFMKDFAPYLEKIKASGAEVIYTGDWVPDAENLLVQARQMGIKLPIANLFLNEPTMLHKAGVEGTKNLHNFCMTGTAEGVAFPTAEQIKYYHAWYDQFKKWKAPYNKMVYKHGWGAGGSMGSYMMQLYWLLSVMERAGSTDPEKIISVWEGDSYRDVFNTVYYMRPCDHKVIADYYVQEYDIPEKQKANFNIPPYYYFKGCCNPAKTYRIPAAKCLPPMDRKLARCKDKDLWGN